MRIGEGEVVKGRGRSGEGEKNVRIGEGEAAKGKGRRGEGEKYVRIGQVEVGVQEGAGVRREDRSVREEQLSPVLKLGSGKPKVAKKDKVVVLNIDAEGKVSRSLETDDDGEEEQLENHAAGNTTVHGLLEYNSSQDDRDWAHSGIVATLALDETLLLVQQRVEDAGFTNVEVISMDGDKVFLRCRNNEDTMQVFNEAIHFFGMLFSAIHRWMSSDAMYERGVWVRIYGTPIHAWNTNFFKLCASQYGRFIKADECTLERGRIDYARILISTSSVGVF